MLESHGVTGAEIRRAIRALRLGARPVCMHSSLRSFGWVEGGAATVVDAVLAEECTLLVPTFSGAAYEAWPDPPDVIERNGWRGPAPAGRVPGVDAYTPASAAIDADMGAIPAAVLSMPGRVRGAHPLDSFTAMGPLAHALVDGQSPRHVYAPLEALVAAGGAVVLAGVGLTAMTLIHLAEQRAGRALFVRWARDLDGAIVRVRVGGCSEGFGNLAAALSPAMTKAKVGQSRWMVMDAARALDLATAAIRAEPRITHCDSPECDRCNDAVRGGPAQAN
jgi:aminoglycoside 3-N-acetyltransferase